MPRFHLTNQSVAIHQANYARILSLRQTAETLDENIKATLRTLVETRKELLSIPARRDAVGIRETTYSDVLKYGKFISKTTVPPTFRGNAPKDILNFMQPTVDPSLTQITNGMATPAGAGPDGEGSQHPAEGLGVSTLSQDAKDMLDPLSKLPFVPWPSQDIIRMGALAHIQGMLETGTDPSTVLSKEEQEAADKQEADEKERLRQEEEERDRRRRESYVMRGPGRQENPEAVFDPDEL